MPSRDIGTLLFTTVYPLYVRKAERKGRTRAEVDAVIGWLTGYTPEQLEGFTQEALDFRAFFEGAPADQPRADRVTGVVCGVRVETLEDPLTRKIRTLDKLVDELAKGRPLDRILR